METKSTNNGFSRRSFIKWSGVSMFLTSFLSIPKFGFGKTQQTGGRNYWIDGEEGKYFAQDTVYTGEGESGYIWAKADGWWRRFKIQELDEKFWDWNFNERLERLEQIGEGKMPTFGGAHNPAVASYGNRRGRFDSRFHLNNAIKGMGLCPAKEHIKEMLSTMQEMFNESQEVKVNYLKEIYSNRDLWCKDKQASLEIYTVPEFETHSFLNQMENPLSTMVFMAIAWVTSYEVRCIARLLHPLDPNLSDEERDLMTFPGLMHAFFHGGETEKPAAIYYHVEEFNNTPGPPWARPGQRVVPEILYEAKQKIKKLWG